MGMNSALKTAQILEVAQGVLGIELMAAAQALDFRDYQPGRGTAAAKAAVRRRVEHLDEDRPLFPDHNLMLECVRNLEPLRAVEEAIGALAVY
jgi:histidine ammonia-lyase